MAVYQLKTFGDIVNSIREELGVQSTDTTAINRIKRVANMVYAEVVSKKKWYWLNGNKDITLPAYVNAGTATVTQNSANVTLTIAPASSKVGYYFALDGYSEVYTVESHTAASVDLKLANVYTGSTIAGVNYKIWSDKLALPTDCKETSEVSHDFYRQPMDNVGRQEFNRIKRLSPRNEAKPMAYFTGDYNDPAQTSSIASFPSISTRSSALMRKTIVFSSALPTAVVTAVTAGDPVRWRVSNAGHPSYNGDIIVSSISTTNVANDTITYTGAMEYTELTVVDSSMVISSLDQEQDYDRYRELFVYPALTNTPITLHIEYSKEALPLNSDSDEPVIPIHDRIVLRYGSLAILWPSIGRNPEEGMRNAGLYEQKINQMESKWQDSQDNAILRPSRNYLGAKRNILRKRAIDLDSGPLIAGGSSGAQTVTGAANSVAQFGPDGILVGSAVVSTTELGYLDGVTSSVQAQIDAKQTTTLSNGSILVGNASNVATPIVVNGDITLSNTGDAQIVAGSIVDADINTSAGIVDTKLATIATAGKVSNSATTAASANTASAIVARDISGDFSAGTITADLTGTASGNTTYTPNNHGVVLSGSGNAMTVVAPDASTVKVLTSGGASADPSWQSVPTSSLAVTTKTANYTALTSDDLILCNTNAFTVTLPAATSTGKVLRIKKIGSDTNSITIARAGSDTIDGATSLSLAKQYEEVTIIADGSSSWLIQNFKKNPTIQTLTSGTGTYTTASGVNHIRVRMVGGGGGGGAGTSQTLAGGTGGTSFFRVGASPDLLVANGGGGGTTGNSANGVGGSATISSPAYGTAITGASSTGCGNAIQLPGTAGGGSPFGGAGAGGNGGGGSGASGAGNSGSGGGGGGTAGSGVPGAGGSAGGYLDAIIPSPSATYSYAVGAGGSAGTGGVAAGPGGSGYIEVTEYYQ